MQVRPFRQLFGFAAAVLVLGWASFSLQAATLDEAAALFKAHNFPAAESAFASVANEQPDNGAAYAYWALTLAELQRNDDARAKLDKARELNAPVDIVKTAEARLDLGAQQPDQALAKLNEALAANPDSALALHYRGLAYANKRDYAKASEDLERSLELDPAFPYSHYYLGMAYNGMRRPDKALSNLQQFVQQAPDAPDADKVRSLLRSFK